MQVNLAHFSPRISIITCNFSICCSSFPRIRLHLRYRANAIFRLWFLLSLSFLKWFKAILLKNNLCSRNPFVHPSYDKQLLVLHEVTGDRQIFHACCSLLRKSTIAPPPTINRKCKLQFYVSQHIVAHGIHYNNWLHYITARITKRISQ